MISTDGEHEEKALPGVRKGRKNEGWTKHPIVSGFYAA